MPSLGREKRFFPFFSQRRAVRPVDAIWQRPELAAAYEAEEDALLVSRLRLTCWLAIVLVPLFGVLDAIIYPDLLGSFLLIRLGTVLIMLAVLALLTSHIGGRLAMPLSLLAVSATGLGIVGMTALSGGASAYYAGVNLVLLAAAVLLPWRPHWTISVGALFVGAYSLSSVASGLEQPRVFIAHLFFLCSTVLISAVSHFTGERSRRRDFLQRAALEEAGRQRDRFLANITHELRTPLAAILGFAELLSEQLDSAVPEKRDWLERIQANATTLYRLISQLLDFSRLEAGAVRLQSEPVDLAAIVTKVAIDMRAIAGEGGVRVGTEISREPLWLRGDAQRIEEIVTNLAANALKFSGGRPIQLALRRSSPAASAWQRAVPPLPEPGPGAFIEINVSDRGDGIVAADVRRLFVAFQQLDAAASRHPGGTGLGLSISAHLATVMGGHIAVRSTPGQGSTFALLLPLGEKPSGEHDEAD